MELSISEQQERAAKAEESLLELQQRLANRRITEQQLGVMIPLLQVTKFVRPVELKWVTTAEASAFAQDILGALKKAGWPVKAVGGVLSPSPPAGLFINTSALGPDTAALQAALKAVGFETSVVLQSGFEDRFQLMIGSRP